MSNHQPMSKRPYATSKGTPPIIKFHSTRHAQPPAHLPAHGQEALCHIERDIPYNGVSNSNVGRGGSNNMVCFNNGPPHAQPTKLAKCIETRQLGVGTTTIDLSTLVDVFSQVSRNGHMNDVRGAYVWLHACRSPLGGCPSGILGYVDIVNSCIATSAREAHQYPRVHPNTGL